MRNTVKLTLPAKILIYCTASSFVFILLLYISSLCFDKNTLMWITVLVVLISVLFSFFISKNVKKYNNLVLKTINKYAFGNAQEKKSIKKNVNDKELLDLLDKLEKLYNSDYEEKISNEKLAMMGEFSTFIIHDLKNPVSGIHLLAEGLNKKIKDNNELKKYANEILMASQKLDDFIKKTLDITKSLEIHRQRMNINVLIEDVINDTDVQDIKFEKSLDPSLPDIIGDYQLLTRVIINVMNNAVESIVNNGIIKIETRFNEKIFVTISDNGNGIDEKRIKTIFQPFYSSKEQGHGLGLAFAKKVIMMHQGKIHVESQQGKGSVFTITLPVPNSKTI